MDQNEDVCLPASDRKGDLEDTSGVLQGFLQRWWRWIVGQQSFPAVGGRPCLGQRVGLEICCVDFCWYGGQAIGCWDVLAIVDGPQTFGWFLHVSHIEPSRICVCFCLLLGDGGHPFPAAATRRCNMAQPVGQGPKMHRSLWAVPHHPPDRAEVYTCSNFGNNTGGEAGQHLPWPPDGSAMFSLVLLDVDGGDYSRTAILCGEGSPVGMAVRLVRQFEVDFLLDVHVISL